MFDATVVEVEEEEEESSAAVLGVDSWLKDQRDPVLCPVGSGTEGRTAWCQGSIPSKTFLQSCLLLG